MLTIQPHPSVLERIDIKTSNVRSIYAQGNIWKTLRSVEAPTCRLRAYNVKTSTASIPSSNLLSGTICMTKHTPTSSFAPGGGEAGPRNRKGAFCCPVRRFTQGTRQATPHEPQSYGSERNYCTRGHGTNQEMRVLNMEIVQWCQSPVCGLIQKLIRWSSQSQTRTRPAIFRMKTRKILQRHIQMGSKQILRASVYQITLDQIIVSFKATCGNVGRIYLALDQVQWSFLVNTVLNLPAASKTRNLLIS